MASVVEPVVFPLHRMLSIGSYPSGQQCNAVALQKPLLKTFFSSGRTHQPQVTTACFPTRRLAYLGPFYAIWHKRSGFCAYASNGQKQGSHGVAEVEDFDEDDDFWEDEEEGFSDEIDGDDGDGDGDEDEEFIPLINMKRWLAKKPRGFGEGKVYDTSIEDKLMEEIEQSRRAQLANINRLKDNPVGSITKNNNSVQEKGKFASSEGNQQVFRVRLVNLPKKKNIHKDLSLAFKGVPGILQIIAVNSGNKKTREPICKGLAYIDFKTETEAERFVRTFSGQSIAFGKVQKQITCEMNLSSLKSWNELSAEGIIDPALPALPRLYKTEQTRLSRFDSDGDQLLQSSQFENAGILEDDQSLPLPNRGGPGERKKATRVKSSSLKTKKEPHEKDMKLPSKPKKERIPKTNIPGSANRLKIREKAVLAGVFSKYVAKEGKAD